jgi:hypothetical protein
MDRRESLLHAVKNVDPKKDVLLVCSDTMRGQKGLNAFISELNQGEKWIEARFGDRISSGDVSERFGCALAMFGTGGSVIQSLKKKSKSCGMIFPELALTMNEVRTVLNHLKDKKSTKGIQAQAPVVQETHRVFSSAYSDAPDMVIENGVSNEEHEESDILVCNNECSEPTEDLVTETVVPEVSIDNALANIDSFRSTIEAVGESIIVVGEAYKTLQEENNNLRRELARVEKTVADTQATCEANLHKKEIQIGELIAQLSVAQEETTKNLGRIRSLEEENESYKSQLESIKNLLGLKK